MRYTTAKLFTMALVALLAGPENAQAQTFVNWTGGTGNWNNHASWFNEGTGLPGTLPSADFSEIARIDAGGIVTVNTALANGSDGGFTTNPGEVRLGSVTGVGELVIANTGTLRVHVAENVDGGIDVGGAGTGILRVLPGAALTVDGPLTSSPGAANLIQLGAATGAGTANVTVGSASFGGTTLVHRNTAFNSTSTIGLQSSSIYRPVFSGGFEATLQASGSVGLAGTLRPDFGGVAPVVGSSWNLLEGSNVSGAFTTVDPSLAGTLGVGQAFVVTTANVAGNRQAVRLSLRQLAVLNINRDTGVVSLTNPGATPISLDGYTIASNLGSLSPSGWNSLQDQGGLGGQWRESPATVNRVSELKRSGVGTLAAGQSVSLGTLFAPNPSTIGTPTEDLALQFTSPDGVFNGLVNYTGTRVNNILLQIDPSSGQAQLRNTSAFTVQMDGYTISSAAGSLTPNTWTSLDDQNAAGGDWRESPGATTRLSELKRASFTTLAPGATFNLGAIYNPTLSKDIAFHYLTFGQSQPNNGQVLFTPISNNIPGDFNDDGSVNGTDLTIWRGAMGSSPAGDADNDGDTDGMDFLVWQRNVGAAAVAAGSVAVPTIPEPSTIAIAFAAISSACGTGRRQRSGRSEFVI